MFKIEINSLENEKQEIIRFYKKQVEAFRYLKKELDNTQWYDANYDMLVTSMNEIGRALSNMLQSITNGHDVHIISEMIPLAQAYVENERKFPKI